VLIPVDLKSFVWCASVEGLEVLILIGLSQYFDEAFGYHCVDRGVPGTEGSPKFIFCVICESLISGRSKGTWIHTPKPTSSTRKLEQPAARNTGAGIS
jgi:hypothetical protein